MDRLERVHLMEFFQVQFCAWIGGCAGDRDSRAGDAQLLTETISMPELHCDTHVWCPRVQDKPFSQIVEGSGGGCRAAREEKGCPLTEVMSNLSKLTLVPGLCPS